MAKREHRTERRRKEIAERRLEAKGAVVQKEVVKLVDSNRWILWVADGIPFLILALGYGSVYWYNRTTELDALQLGICIAAIAVMSMGTMAFRARIIEFFVERIKQKQPPPEV